jgi:hypothetical protein
MAAEKTVGKRRGRPFPKGRSGNLSGRPLGARNAATVIAEQLLDAETLVRKVIDKAKRGDMTALRVCLDRILPYCREGDTLVVAKLDRLARSARLSVIHTFDYPSAEHTVDYPSDVRSVDHVSAEHPVDHVSAEHPVLGTIAARETLINLADGFTVRRIAFRCGFRS